MFHSSSTGDSHGLVPETKAELTPLGIFYNNRVHSNFKVLSVLAYFSMLSLSASVFYRDKRNTLFITSKKVLHIMFCSLTWFFPEGGMDKHTHARVGSTIVLCCVMTEVRQVNCKFFVRPDHSSSLIEEGAPRFRTIPRLCAQDQLRAHVSIYTNTQTYYVFTLIYLYITIHFLNL